MENSWIKIKEGVSDEAEGEGEEKEKGDAVCLL